VESHPQDYLFKESRDEMKNTYEMPEIIELGNAQQLILGRKDIDPFGFDWILGPGFSTWLTDDDIDESDE
jgi:hypothetical protein